MQTSFSAARGRRLSVVALALLLATGAPAQMQPRARLKGEWLPIVMYKPDLTYVLKDGEKRHSDDITVDIQPADSFGPGFVAVANVAVDLDPLRHATAKEREKPNRTALRFEADLTADRDLGDCYALLPYVTGGSIGTSLIPVGHLSSGRVRHLKVELDTTADDVGFLHVFSEAKEVRTSQLPKAYDVREYFAGLRKKSPGVPALELCKSAEVHSMALSNDGNLLAMVQDRDTHFSIMVVDLAAMKLVGEFEAGRNDEPVGRIQWISAHELAFVAGENLKVLDLTTKSCRKLLDKVWDILGAAKDRPWVLEVIGGAWAEKYDVRREHEAKLENFDSGIVYFNEHGDVRVCMRYDGGGEAYYYRPEAGSRWKPLDEGVKQPGLKFSVKDGDLLDRVADIQAIAPDGDDLYIATRLGSDVFQLATFSMREGVIRKVIARDPAFDLTTQDNSFTRLLFRKGGTELVGMFYEADRPRVVWIDPGSARVQKAIDQAFPDHVNVPVDWSEDASTFIYLSYSDRDPGTFYVFRPREGKVIPVLALAEALKDRKLAQTTPFDFRSRDGATIHAYVTYPPENNGVAPPLVVFVHGGPALRDIWGFDAMNQFLATRGYAVLQVNYRGSSGYGAAYQAAGLRARLDTVVVDDIADGARYLIQEGRVDKSRVAVIGASFGGWATYMSLIKYPELYRTGVAIAAVSHWKQIQHVHHGAWNKLSYNFWQNVLGAKFAEEEKFIDPYLRAAEIKQPVYIMHGALDYTVPIEQAELMHTALAKTNPGVRFMRFASSSHTDWPLADRVIQMNEIGDFLRRNLAPPAPAR